MLRLHKCVRYDNGKGRLQSRFLHHVLVVCSNYRQLTLAPISIVPTFTTRKAPRKLAEEDKVARLSAGVRLTAQVLVSREDVRYYRAKGKEDSTVHSSVTLCARSQSRQL